MKRKVFTKEFKLETVRLLESSGRAAAVMPRELGLRRNQLYKWQAEFRFRGARAFPGRFVHGFLNGRKQIGEIAEDCLVDSNI